MSNDTEWLRDFMSHVQSNDESKLQRVERWVRYVESLPTDVPTLVYDGWGGVSYVPPLPRKTAMYFTGALPPNYPMPSVIGETLITHDFVVQMKADLTISEYWWLI